MRSARWLVPLLLVVPLAAPEPAAEVVTGRTYTLQDTPRTPIGTPASSSAGQGDGIVFLGARLLARDGPAPPAPPATGGDASSESGHPEVPLGPSSVGHAPAAPTPPALPPPATPDPPEAPSEGEGEAAPAPAPPEAEAPAEPEPEPEPAPACEGLCFAIELDLL